MRNIICIVLITVVFSGCSKKLTDVKKLDLKNKLAAIVKTDQIAAFRWEKQWDNFKDSVFTSHKVQVEKLFKKYGYLGFDKVGQDGSDNFWLIVQHCDKFPEFQKKVLIAMNKEVQNKNANPKNYAYLYDRLEVNAGNKQLFGTQVEYEVETSGRAFVKHGLTDSVNVDLHRKKYDLNPLKEYLNIMTKMHYEMNKARYQGMGIAKPVLY